MRQYVRNERALQPGSHQRTVWLVVVTAVVLWAAVPAHAAPSDCRPKSCQTDDGGSSDTGTGTAVAPPAQFTGSLSKSVQSATHLVRFSGGVAEVALTFTRASSLSLQIRAASGSEVARGTGPSILRLSAAVEAGDYELVVSGADRASYTLDVTETAAPAPEPTEEPPPAEDTTPPAVTIHSPGSGATVSGVIDVTGTATDDTAMHHVELRVDDQAWRAATGTDKWSAAVDTSSLADGMHTVTVRGVDTSGNEATRAVSVTTSNSSEPSGDITLADPAAANGLALLGRGAMAQSGDLTALLYWEEFTPRRAVFFRDGATDATSFVNLPVDTANGWSNAAYVFSGDELTILSGSGPIYLRRYRLSGGTPPSSAELLSSQTFGNSDSRMGALTALRSGAIAAAWHQQGETGSQGHHVLYRSASGITQLQSVGFIPTRASKDALVQHPGDGSVWLFNNPDAWSSIGAARFTETASGLALAWSDAYYIDSRYGEFDADPENPDLAVAADPATGHIVLAYQSAHRHAFATNRIGSWPAVARIGATGTPSFVHLPVYVERISTLGLSVGQDGVVLAYRPMEEATLTFDVLHRARYRNGVWETPTALGRLKTAYGIVTADPTGGNVAAQMSDGTLHFFPGT